MSPEELRDDWAAWASPAGAEYESLFFQLPRDEHGGRTSIGSLEHESGLCEPCRFMRTDIGCRTGWQCRYCHFPHARPHNSTAKKRHCKAKRERISRQLTRAREHILESNQSFQEQDLLRMLPHSVPDRAKMLMLEHLKTFAQGVNQGQLTYGVDLGQQQQQAP